MASYQKRGKKWQYSVSHYINGIYQPIRKGGFSTKKEAMIAASEIENKLNKGIPMHLKPIPFIDYFKQWVIDYKVNLSEWTKSRYDNSADHIEKYFKNKHIQKIDKRTYQRFLNDFAKKRSKETVRKIHTHIRACILDAVEEGIIHIDFTRNAVISGSKSKKAEEKHLNFDEAKKLLELVYSNIDESLFAPLIILGLATGFRYSELVGLTVNDFDFESNTISVDKTWNYKRLGGFGPTKNEASERIIDVDEQTMKTLLPYVQLAKNNPHKLVFYQMNTKSKVITNEGANKYLKRQLESLGISHITMHGLRHTHISILLYKRVSIYYVAERAGHSSVDTTTRYYAHVIKEMREEDSNISTEIFKNMSVVNV